MTWPHAGRHPGAPILQKAHGARIRRGMLPRAVYGAQRFRPAERPIKHRQLGLHRWPGRRRPRHRKAQSIRSSGPEPRIRRAREHSIRSCAIPKA